MFRPDRTAVVNWALKSYLLVVNVLQAYCRRTTERSREGNGLQPDVLSVCVLVEIAAVAVSVVWYGNTLCVCVCVCV